MAFNNTNSADLLALKTEVTTDPISMGYNLNGAISQVVKKLNDPDLNVDPNATDARPFDAEALLDALVPTDLDAQQTNAQATGYTHILIEMAAQRSIESHKAKWASMFAGNSATKAALDAQSVRISRAVVLFGTGSNITENDIALALAA